MSAPPASPVADRTVEDAVRAAMRPPDRRPPWQWCEDHLVLDDTSSFGAGQKWKSATSPWSRRIMEAFADPKVKRVTAVTCAQGAKTQTIIGLVCWAIAEDPGPMLWVTASRDDVATFTKNRIDPTFARCRPVRKLLRAVGDGSTKGNYSFDGMTFELVGAGSPSKLQSRPIRYLILDEARNYDDGAIEMARERVRTYEKSGGAKTLMITTAKHEGDTIDQALKNGTCEKWHYPCLGCGAAVELRWGDTTGETPPLMKWGDRDDPLHTRYKDEKGRWLYDKLAPTIRHECPHCGHAHYDTPAVRRHILDRGGFVVTNTSAPADHVSLTYSALLPGWVAWRSVVEKFLDAMGALKLGNISPLERWVGETLGQSWSDRLRDIRATDRLDHLRGSYSLGAEWPGEKLRLMGVDRQAKNGDHFLYVVRAFGEGGESRLIAYGTIHSGPGLEERLDAERRKLGVAPTNVLVDAGYQALEMYRACVRYGWRPLRGDDAKFFTETDDDGKKIRRGWKSVYPDEYRKIAGRASRLILWSNDFYFTALEHLMSGRVGAWTIAQDTDDDYCRQLTAVERREVAVGNRTEYRWVKVRRDDHFRDAETMLLIAALEKKLIHLGAESDAETVSAEA